MKKLGGGGTFNPSWVASLVYGVSSSTDRGCYTEKPCFNMARDRLAPGRLEIYSSGVRE